MILLPMFNVKSTTQSIIIYQSGKNFDTLTLDKLLLPPNLNFPTHPFKQLD